MYGYIQNSQPVKTTSDYKNQAKLVMTDALSYKQFCKFLRLWVLTVTYGLKTAQLSVKSSK